MKKIKRTKSGERMDGRKEKSKEKRKTKICYYLCSEQRDIADTESIRKL